MKIKQYDDYITLINDGWKVVYNKKHMYMFKGHTAKDFIIWNSDLPFRQFDKYGKKITHHTHLKKENVGKTLCDRIATNKIPYGIRSKYLKSSYLRCADEEYRMKLEEYFKRKEEKSKEHYININKGNRKCG